MEKLKQHGGNHRTHGMCVESPELYNLWWTMKSRCNNPHRSKYKDYGMRGITVCKEWENDAKAFCEWATQNGYRKGLQIDRIDNDKGYSPENCRFVTPKENSRNRRNTVYLTVNGETKNVSEWCETMPISQYTIYWWVREKGKEYAEKRMTEALRRRANDGET